MESCLAVGESSTEIASNRAVINTSNMLPIGIMTVATLQGQPFKRPLKVLFDSGSSRTLIHTRVIPPRLDSHQLEQQVILHTGGGTIQAKDVVTLQDIRFPKLSPTRAYINAVEAIVSPHTALYDVILGHDVMVPAHMAICLDTQTIQWGGLSVSWKLFLKILCSTNIFGRHVSQRQHKSEAILSRYN
jgi:hypothetical protein